MADSAKPPKPIGELIDDIERIREDLFHLQRELEKIEVIDKALDEAEED
jgi:hypothetical protein